MKKHLIAIAAATALLSAGGCATIQRAAEAAADRTEAGYGIAAEAQARADEWKAQIAEDNLARARDQIEFSTTFGAEVDTAGLDWLDAHLRRIGNFVCELHQRGIVIDDIATRDPAAIARVTCVTTPPPQQ